MKEKKLMDNKENCPNCGSNLQGEPIPVESQRNYGATHFSRKIGIYSRETDKTVEWKCPDCDYQWER